MHIALSDYLLDITQNAFEADSTAVELSLLQRSELIDCVIRDNGKGMDDEKQRRALDPFYSEEGKHDARRFGLGLPFLAQAVEAVDGTFLLESEVGVGTTVHFTMDGDHVDAPPLGDLPLTFCALLSHPKAEELTIDRRMEADGVEDGYTLRRTELLSILGDFERSANLALLREYVASQETDLLHTVRYSTTGE
jgi:anti-sigma regulatory factor (Ser/Thr protein kinase)